MTTHSHNFVEDYSDLIGFGFDRETDESTLICYLQKFSDDRLMQTLLPRLNATELETIFALLSRLLKTHLSETEYHTLFLKDSP